MGMSRRMEAQLQIWLAEGRRRIGQIVIHARPGAFLLRHGDDAEDAALEEFANPEAALELGRFNENDQYRPLKTAPDLRRGWRLRLGSLAEVVLALDYFYPAMLGSLRAATEGELRVTPLHETLARQTGMYAITRKATVEQTEAVIARRCSDEGGCLKRILWTVEQAPPRTLPAEKFILETSGPLPMPCAEGCNLLVAAIRKHLKQPA